ncbi:MAG: histidine kinase [Alphaproteobacteria bacterium]|nr:MAG: histidine kinase [Alphaproteobacteria bacterium]
MRGTLIAGGMLAFAAAFGAALWYFQTVYWYRPVALDPAAGIGVPMEGTSDPAEAAALAVTLVRLSDGQPEVIPVEDFRATNAPTSPIKLRACFRVPFSLAHLTEAYRLYEGATPLKGPGWFDCFDYAQLTRDLEDGTALAFLAAPDVADGVDRVVAVYPDGRAYMWQQLRPGAFADGG